jgi:uncharacterized protein (TIGR03382 family)
LTGSSDNSSESLAFTGVSEAVPIAGAGAFLILLGILGRRRSRRSEERR